MAGRKSFMNGAQLCSQDAYRSRPSDGVSVHMAGAAALVEEAQAGRMFVLIDDERRENEGDLVVPAQFATPEAINFMARYARGLICLAMTRKRLEELHLPLMAQTGCTRTQTAFTASIEAKEGVTTGISTYDRAHTIAVAINPNTRPSDIVSPGHVFPIMARDGGTLIRAGHTEGAVDIARLAGLIPAGVICEIMNPDGTMARLPELINFAQRHDLKVGSIADLIAHRSRSERLVTRVRVSNLRGVTGGDWTLYAYESAIDDRAYVALTKGDLSVPGPVMVRVHAGDFVTEILGGRRLTALHNAMRIIAEQERGVLVLISDSRSIAPSQPPNRSEMSEGHARPVLRDYGTGAQILMDLGVQNMILLSDTDQIISGLEGYGLTVVAQRSICGWGNR
jgi:3,4-dihydroxy 2-butanone 4-phosphate synthase/GTP cyclohydrolase II